MSPLARAAAALAALGNGSLPAQVKSALAGDNPLPVEDYLNSVEPATERVDALVEEGILTIE